MSSLSPIEKIPADEEKYTEQLRKLAIGRLREQYAKGLMRRSAHPKMHGLVRAYFIVEPDLPAELKVGLFAEPRRYKAWIRFSNQSETMQPDSKRDIRGMAIKLMGVPGQKLLDDQLSANTHDFVLISTDVFVAANVREFAGLAKAMSGGMLALSGYFLGHWRVAYNLWHSLLKIANPLQTRYFSTTPYLFGERAVKYTAVPVVPSLDQMPDNPAEDYLRHAMVRQLSKEDVVFNFMLQLPTDPQQMPVEDPGKLWPESSSPYRKVATIRIPRQSFDSEVQRDFGENLAFNPWRALPQHRPLGGINRARKVIYHALSDYRRRKNMVQPEEPENWNIPGLDPAEQMNSRFAWGNTSSILPDQARQSQSS